MTKARTAGEIYADIENLTYGFFDPLSSLTRDVIAREISDRRKIIRRSMSITSHMSKDIPIRGEQDSRHNYDLPLLKLLKELYEAVSE